MGSPTLAPVNVICGHYGVGKTNLSLNLALDAARAGCAVALVDLDVVNPYFRSTEYRALLEANGVRVIAPVFAEAGTSLDVPSITAALVPAVEAAYAAYEEEGASAHADGSLPSVVVIIDAGGDDAGATALGRFARTVEAGPYALFYVVNRARNLTHEPAEAVQILREVEGASHLRATAVISNAHLKADTTCSTVVDGAVFARAVADAADLPLACITVPDSLLRQENEELATLGRTENLYPVQVYVKAPWEA